MSKPNQPCSKPFCDCQRSCECKTCPSVLQKLNLSSSSYVCNHGTRPKCECEDESKKKAATCLLCSLDEPEPTPDPERTQSIMSVLKYDKSCNCSVVTRAVRADVHRHLGMLDRYQKKSPTPDITPATTPPTTPPP